MPRQLSEVRNVLITGGSRGLGRGMVLRFAEAGWGVAFTYVSNEEKAKETLAEIEPIVAQHGRLAKMYRLDIADPEQVEAVGDEVLQDFEDIHAVVNNAGINKNGPAVFLEDDDWRSVIDTNLSGAFWVSRQFLAHFVSNRFGRLIHISSLASDGSSGQINYAAAKAGLHGMSRTIAKEYGSKGITSNVLIPGVFPTDMTEANLSQGLSDFWNTFVPIKRVGEPHELADVALFLCSDQAVFVNGVEIHVTGGLTYTP